MASDLVGITERLRDEVGALRFESPTEFVYNPLDYARESHGMYIERYGKGTREFILLGMNPGPFGMAQTGVPFGDVSMVRDWMGIEAPVGKPPKEHPKRPIDGFACTRNEVSGTRLWGWARDQFGTPKKFFKRFFVVNYCPLCFMEESGRNRTPDKLPAKERDAVNEVCNRAFKAMVESMQPKMIIGVGQFAEKQAGQALEGLDVPIARILHPSPASPAANRGWAEAVQKQVAALGISI